MEDREDKAIVEAYERQLRQDHGMGSGDEEQDWEEPEPCSICNNIVGKAIIPSNQLTVDEINEIHWNFVQSMDETAKIFRALERKNNIKNGTLPEHWNILDDKKELNNL